MAYLLDSDIVIDHLAGDPEARQLIDLLAAEGVAISAVTYMEVYQGTLTAPDPGQARAKLDALMAEVPIVPFSTGTARRCALLRTNLVQRRRRVRSRALDLLIAATALEHGLTLVTRNLADYHDIPELPLRPFS